MLFSKEMLHQKLVVLPARRLVYLNNAKVGCSTIKKSLWKSVTPDSFDPARPPHSRQGSPFRARLAEIAQDPGGLSQSTFFTVVRNPYARILSAYLDKIMGDPRDLAVWIPFSCRFELPSSSRPPLVDLLERFAEEPPELLDQHFAPQHVNTLHDYVECDHVGHLEQMDGVAGFLAGHGIEISTYSTHGTSASDKVAKNLTPREIDLIRKIYARDFELFGYGEDPARLAPERPVQQAPVGKTRLVLLLQSIAAGRPADRATALEKLSRLMPEHDSLYTRLETGALEGVDMKGLLADIMAGRIANWRVIVMTAHIMLRRDRVAVAQGLLDAALRVMRHGARPGQPPSQ